MHAAIRSSALRSTRARVAATPGPAPMMRSAVIQRRFATKVEEAASKVKQAAEQAAETIKPSHHKPSSDVPWMVGSVLVFAPLIVWMTSPSSKKDDHHHAEPKKEKFKPHLRLPDVVHEENPSEESAKQPEAPEGLPAGEGRGHGEGDHGLRAKIEEDGHHHQDKQKQGSDSETEANNHGNTGLTGDSAKFNSAARMSQKANETGGGEAARNPKAVVAAARAASKQDKEDDSVGHGHGGNTVPETAGKHIGEKLTESRENKTEESDKADSGENKQEQL